MTLGLPLTLSVKEARFYLIMQVVHKVH